MHQLINYTLVLFTGYRFNLGTAVGADQGLNVNQLLTSADGEKTAVFESFYIPPFASIVVKNVAIQIDCS